ncbi:MAG: T9SS type A sorting domain-containing protein [Bacteroidetes bacterium]|nr:T9SS type A sorting domain-containing protein [Bacteroidota bacterium]
MRFSITSCVIFVSAFVALYSQPTTTLTVLNGYGSGEYKQGDTIHIWAKEFAEDSVFAGWETPLGSAEVALWNEWHTTIIMRGSSGVIRAKFRYSKPLQFSQTTFRILGADRNIWYAFPPSPRGLITLHHFTNGTGNLWTSRTEYRQFCHAAYDMGYALLAYNADEVERGDQTGNGLKQWLATPIDMDKNIDHKVTRIMLDSLIARGVITKNTPLFAVGMSVGGGYTMGVALSLGFNGWANYCSGGNSAITDSTHIPGLLCPAQNDANREDDIGGNTIKAYQNYLKLQQRGIKSGYLLNTRHPLYPERFARIKGINKAKSIELFNELKNGGWLDSLNRPLLLPDSLEQGIRYTALFPEFSAMNEDLWKEALYQYRVAYADHEFHSDFTYSTLSFFDSLQKSTAIEPAFCDSIYIDSMKILTELPFIGDLMIYFRNEGSLWSSYPILKCKLEDNPYYTANPENNVRSVFDNKGGSANGRTQFNVNLIKTTSPLAVPKDFVLKGTATLCLLNDKLLTRDTCIFTINFKPNTSSTTSTDENLHDYLHGLVISPTLADSYLSIEYPDDLRGAAYIEIINMYGNIAKSERAMPNKTVLNTSELPIGSYIVRIGTITKKFVVVR